MAKKPAPSTEPTIKRGSIRDYIPAEINPNKSNPRGVPAIVNSLHQFGAGRSVVVDRDGEAIGGSHTIQAAIDAGITDVIEVESDGDALIVHKRRDLDLTTDAKARGLQIADNRTSELGYTADEVVLRELLDQIGKEDVRFVLAAGYEDYDVKALVDALEHASPDEWDNALGGLADGDRAPFQQMTFTLHDEQAEQVKRAIDLAKSMGVFVDSPNENSNGNALARICEIFITDHER